jgi:uncharacterized protein DUF6717
MNNSIFSIEVYKHQGMWVFDDDRVGLVKEPFVAGADTLIDKLYLSVSRDTASFMVVPRLTLIFSDQEFPSHKLMITKCEHELSSGTTYYCPLYNHDLWLCPALNLYYPVSPEIIYVDYKL